ncbi:MAG: TIGR02281 family clan AA aspartic protease [Magnetococcales bacterium]|nr:TIGR02281 family clan AA aspartic protease [Magnetococcales bacterium]
MTRFALLFVGGLIVAAFLQDRFVGPIFASDMEWLGYASGALLMLAWMLSPVRWRAVPALLRRVGIWVGMVALLIAGYGFRPELARLGERMEAALSPQRGFAGQEPDTWQVFKSADGHFYLEVRINRIPVRFLVDTGASDIVLTRADAQKIGLRPDRLAYTRTYQTANGQTRGAPVVLDELAVGALTLRGMPASVNEGRAHVSLLGMAFFRRIDSYEVRRDLLTLRWRAREP